MDRSILSIRRPCADMHVGRVKHVSRRDRMLGGLLHKQPARYMRTPQLIVT